MARTGPAPKDPDKRARTNATIEMTDIAIDAKPTVKTPTLPDSGKMHPRTRKWYKRWATSPQASRFTPTDWGRLQDLALLVDSYFTSALGDGTPSQLATLMAEIRQNEAKFGATPDDRQRLRWRITALDATAAAEPATGNGTGTRRARRGDPRANLELVQ